MPRSPVRLIEVAQEARVGTSVVSRVLNGDPSLNVRDETRERILEAAARLDYRPNALARGLKLAKTMTIGLVIPLGYSENAELIASIERAAADRGYLTLLADASEFVGHGESYRRLLLERARRRPLDGQRPGRGRVPARAARPRRAAPGRRTGGSTTGCPAPAWTTSGA